MPDNRSVAFNVDAMRRSMLERLALPDDLVQHAIERTRNKLDARVTKFFTHRGEVVSQVDVEDHATQLQAADQIYSLAGLYARERDGHPSTPQVALEIDPVTGVMRLIIGGMGGGDTTGTLTTASATGPQDVRIHEPLAPTATPMALAPPCPPPEDEPEAQVVRVARSAKGQLPDHIKAILFGEADG